MSQYILPFALTLGLSAIFTPIVRYFALKWKLFDYPAPRKVHDKPIPRLGGVAIFLSFILVVVGYVVFAPEKLQFVGEKILGVDKNLLGVLIGAGILISVGIIDDIREMRPIPKLFFQFIAAGIVALFGIKMWWLSNPFGPQIVLGNFSPVFVILWIVLIINVVNWLDGLDGLSTGVSAIACIILFFLSIQPTVNQPGTALLCLIVAASALGFLPFNFNPAKIFLGDSGAMFLGFMVAIFAIISGGKVATALLVLGIPIFDAIWVILRRIWGKKAPWIADKKHLHHRFLKAGFNQKQAVLFLYAITLLFGIISLFSGTLSKFWTLLGLIVLMIALATILIVLEKRRQNESIQNI
ncbi:MAG: MraY family glycosyltransferase [Candidatus Berkelbacteria bacterium]|nr:MraY family glycosyltransferase [Candidatus Berkelbacteria bacterium]